MTSSLLVTCALVVMKHRLDYTQAGDIPLELADKVAHIIRSSIFWSKLTDTSKYKPLINIEFDYNKDFLRWQTSRKEANYSHLFLAASTGDLEHLKYLTSKRNLTPDMNMKMDMLLNAIRNGHLNIVSYLCEELNLQPDGNNLIDCYPRHLAIIKYLCEKLHFQPNKEMMLRIMSLACISDSLDIIKYLCEDLHFQPDENDLDNILLSCPVAVVHYLCKTRQQAELRVLPDVNSLTKACIHGHLDIVSYLCEELHLQPNKDALVNACYYGKTHVARYLCNELNPAALRVTPTAYHLNLACNGPGNKDIVLCLCNEFNINLTHNNFTSLIKQNKLKTVIYFCDQVEPAERRVRPTRDTLYEVPHGRKYLPMFNYILEKVEKSEGLSLPTSVK